MGLDYNKSANTAKKLITRFGKDFTIRNESKGAYDASTNIQATTSTDYTAKAVKLNYNRKDIDGEVIKKNDFKVLCEANVFNENSVEIDTSYKLIENSKQFTIVDVIALKPADTVVYYELQVRG